MLKITQRQLDGISILVVFTLITIFVIDYFTSHHPEKYPIEYADRSKGPIIVEVGMIGSKSNDIFFLPRNSSVSDALNAAHIRDIGEYEKKLLKMQLPTGKRIEIDPIGHIQVHDMSAEKKLAMDIPINVNQVTLDDLTLIPGVGKKTAERILQFRKTNGGFKDLEDLMQINGIKDKKFASLKKYLCVD